MTGIALPPSIRMVNSTRGDQPLKQCDQHKALVPPEGGIQLNPSKWLCASCWVKFNSRKRTQ